MARHEDGISIDDAIDFLNKRSRRARMTQACFDGEARWCDDEADAYDAIVTLLEELSSRRKS